MIEFDDAKELNGGCNNTPLRQKRNRRNKGIRNIWDQFTQQSTLHGLHYVFEKRPTPQRFIWLLLQSVMLSLFFWQTSALALHYLSYSVTSTIQFVTEKESNFPAVTLCNFNKYRKSVIQKENFYKVLTAQYPLYEKDRKPINWTEYADVNSIDLKEFMHRVGHEMEYTNTTELGEVGMLYRCEWRGDVCNHTVFEPILTDMGLCYTFNSGKNNSTVRKAKGIGKHFGLHLKMSVEQHEYIGRLAFSAGLRIRIHDPDEPPLVSSLGFAVMPGSHVFASITKQRTISLPLPYTTMCEDQKLRGMKAYTIAACNNYCKETNIAKECKCQAFYMRDMDIEPCDVQKYFNCVLPMESNSSSASMKDCKCTEPCDTMKYTAYLSYGAFPGLESAKAYGNNNKDKMNNLMRCDDNGGYEKQRKNLLAIDIFFDDLNYNVIKQEPAYSLQNLLGEIGGLMGLFLGASILTVFEFFDVFVMVILTCLGIRKRL